MAKTEKRTGGSYRSLGTTADGVVILAPKLAPTHFKPGEIRKTVARLTRDTGRGAFAPKTDEAEDEAESQIP
jgi:hypothetical protein